MNPPGRRAWPAPEVLDGRLMLSLAPAGPIAAARPQAFHAYLTTAEPGHAAVESTGRIMTPELRQILEARSGPNGPARPPASASFARRTAGGVPEAPAGSWSGRRANLLPNPRPALAGATARPAVRPRIASPTRFGKLTLSSAPGPVVLAPADARFIALSIPQNAAVVTRAIVDLTNHVRAENNLPPLDESRALAEGAQLHSDDMARLDQMLHDIPGIPLGSLPDRARFVHYDYQRLGENIAFNQADAATVVSAWMNSPAHRENMLDPGFTDIGVGLAWNRRGEPYYTLMLGKPA